jgi:hypothetical protein
MPTDLPALRRTSPPDPDSGDDWMALAVAGAFFLAVGILAIVAATSGGWPPIDPTALGWMP